MEESSLSHKIILAISGGLTLSLQYKSQMLYISDKFTTQKMSNIVELFTYNKVSLIYQSHLIN